MDETTLLDLLNPRWYLREGDAGDAGVPGKDAEGDWSPVAQHSVGVAQFLVMLCSLKMMDAMLEYIMNPRDVLRSHAV